MKATGIVRRIDDLGRVVIPKEIRRTMRIREGYPLEIFTEKDGEVVFKKYSPVGELSPFAVQYADVLSRACNMTVLICDRDHVIAASGTGRKDFDSKPISKPLETAIEERGSFLAVKGEKGYIKVTLDDREEHSAQAVSTIICEGDAIGAVVLCQHDEKEKFGETEMKLAQVASGFLSRQMEQ